MADRGIDDCVMEVSSHALVLHRVDEVVYDIALFTNLSQDHLDFHDGMEDYFAAKASLFTPERARQAVVCVDDEWGRRVAQECTIPHRTVSSDPAVPADFVITSVDGPDGRDFVLSGEGGQLALRSHASEISQHLKNELAERLAEPDGPEVVLVSTGRSPSWFDGMTMDTARAEVLYRLEQADRHDRFTAFYPVTDEGERIIVHAKVTVIDDKLLRIGSTNLNNRSMGLRSERAHV